LAIAICAHARTQKIAGPPCALCRSENIPCTFQEGPQPRRKHPAPEEATHEQRPLPPISVDSPVADQTLLYYHGSTELVGDSSHFQELDGPDENFPRFRNVESAGQRYSAHPYASHRTDQTSSKVLSLTNTSHEDLYNTVKPYGQALVDAYWRYVWPVFPGTSKSFFSAFLDGRLPWSNDKQAQITVSPCVAAMMIIGAKCVS
jgi:hypothetical protein